MTDFDNGWLYEAGIGENRAIFVDRGELTKIRIERLDNNSRPGSIIDVTFKKQWVAGRSGIVESANGEEILLQPLSKGLTEGASARVEMVREALSESGGRSKRAKAKPAAAGSELRSGTSLRERMAASEADVRQVYAHDTDLFGEHGWDECLEQAQSGLIAFEGGSLLLSLTPAMTVIDVDGPLSPVELAKRAAKEIALALVRFDIGGNIGIDFPTIEAKSDRTAVGAIFDEYMTGDCERTAINGFGFMQVVRKKLRPSVFELVQFQKVKTATLQLLRRAERQNGTGAVQLTVHPALVSQFDQRPDWLEELSKRLGREVVIESSGKTPIEHGQISSR